MTFCEDCEHLHPASKGPPWRWLCSKSPRMEGYGFITRGMWDHMDPFMLCVGINGGACPMFEQKPEPERTT